MGVMTRTTTPIPVKGPYPSLATPFASKAASDAQKAATPAKRMAVLRVILALKVQKEFRV